MIEHKHLIIRSEVLDPPDPDEIENMEEWFKVLVFKLGMKLLSGPHIKYVDVPGNKGITGVCIIETSHIALHVWDEQKPAIMQLDVYTCGAMDKKVIFDMLQTFIPVKIEYKYLDREHDLKLIDEGTISV
jgi:S-adenosylmethionine/arginine decarboxylase-like enzyme